jgi:hypothetical protein
VFLPGLPVGYDCRKQVSPSLAVIGEKPVGQLMANYIVDKCRTRADQIDVQKDSAGCRKAAPAHRHRPDNKRRLGHALANERLDNIKAALSRSLRLGPVGVRSSPAHADVRARRRSRNCPTIPQRYRASQWPPLFRRKHEPGYVETPRPFGAALRFRRTAFGSGISSITSTI